MCTVLLPPGVNPIAVNKYIYIVLTATIFGHKGPSTGQYLQKQNLKMLMYIVQKHQLHGITLTLIYSLYNYYQPLDVPSVVICVEILYCEYSGCHKNVGRLPARNTEPS